MKIISKNAAEMSTKLVPLAREELELCIWF
jgi:hypothetical protein